VITTYGIQGSKETVIEKIEGIKKIVGPKLGGIKQTISGSFLISLTTYIGRWHGNIPDTKNLCIKSTPSN